MKTGLILLMVISTVLMLATVGSAQENSTNSAAAVMKDANGSTVGFATFTEDAYGMVRIQVFASNLTPGLHGIHIHEKANCAGPSFTSAGGHYNPLGKEHGFDNLKGPHAGDLPNLVVEEDGTGYMDVTTSLVTLSPGKTTLFPANCTSLVIHADPDDQITNPSGNSGARVVCGAIKKR